MEEKVTAVYLLVWKHELAARDEGSYNPTLAAQQEKWFKFIREKGIDESQAARPFRKGTTRAGAEII